jgi:hypothetical protein
MAGVPSSQAPDAEQLLTTLTAKLKQLELAVRTQQADFAALRTAESLRIIGDLELLQVSRAVRKSAASDGSKSWRWCAGQLAAPQAAAARTPHGLLATTDWHADAR